MPVAQPTHARARPLRAPSPPVRALTFRPARAPPFAEQIIMQTTAVVALALLESAAAFSPAAARVSAPTMFSEGDIGVLSQF